MSVFKRRRVVYYAVLFVLALLFLRHSFKEMSHDHSFHDHGHHDHGDMMRDGHEGHGDGDMSMHAMVFHFGVNESILFPGWVSTNAGQLFGACVAIFLAAVLYEGLKFWREYIFLKGASSASATSSQVNITKQECGPNGACNTQRVVKYPMLSGMHVIQTLLHMVQVVMSYLLMLVFMTFNVWLCLALVLGAGLGYFLFAWKKQSVVDYTEHCQ